MADDTYYLLDAVDVASANSPASKVFPTVDAREMSIFFVMPAPSGSASDTLDITVVESDQEAFTDAERTNTITTFSTALGNGGAVTEKRTLNNQVVAPYLKVTYTTGGTATVFDDVTVYVAYNKKV